MIIFKKIFLILGALYGVGFVYYLTEFRDGLSLVAEKTHLALISADRLNENLSLINNLQIGPDMNSLEILKDNLFKSGVPGRNIWRGIEGDLQKKGTHYFREIYTGFEADLRNITERLSAHPQLQNRFRTFVGEFRTLLRPEMDSLSYAEFELLVNRFNDVDILIAESNLFEREKYEILEKLSSMILTLRRSYSQGLDSEKLKTLLSKNFYHEYFSNSFLSTPHLAHMNTSSKRIDNLILGFYVFAAGILIYFFITLIKRKYFHFKVLYAIAKRRKKKLLLESEALAKIGRDLNLERKKNKIISSTLTPQLLVSPDGIIIWCNAGATKILKGIGGSVGDSWRRVYQSYLIDISKETQIPNVHSIRGQEGVHFIVKKERTRDNFYAITIYSPFESVSCEKVARSKDLPICDIYSLIEEMAIYYSGRYPNVEVLADFSRRYPIAFTLPENTLKSLVHDIMVNLIQVKAMRSASHLRIHLDSYKKDSRSYLVFRMDNVRLEGVLLSRKYHFMEKNIRDSFVKIESNFALYNCNIDISITQNSPSKYYSEVIVALDEIKSIDLNSPGPSSKIRPVAIRQAGSLYV